MTDTGQIPGEGLPENAGMVEQPGVPAPGAYTYLSETTAEDEDLLLLPGAQSAWGNEVAPPAPEPVVETVHQPGPHELSGRDSGSVDLGGVRLPDPTPAPEPAAAPVPPRRPLHLGPPIPDTSASPVRSLADRGPADMPVRHAGPPTAGPEYLDVPQAAAMPSQAAAPWGAQAATRAPVGAGAAAAETVVPAPGQASGQAPEAVGAAQALVTRVATEAVAARAGEADASGEPGETGPSAADAPAEAVVGDADGGDAVPGGEVPYGPGAPVVGDGEQAPVAEAAVAEGGVPVPEAIPGTEADGASAVPPTPEPDAGQVAEPATTSAAPVPAPEDVISEPEPAQEGTEQPAPEEPRSPEATEAHAPEPAQTPQAPTAEPALSVVEPVEPVEAVEPVQATGVADGEPVQAADPAQAPAPQQVPFPEAPASLAAEAPEAPAAQTAVEAPAPVETPAPEATAPEPSAETPAAAGQPVPAPQADAAPQPDPEPVPEAAVQSQPDAQPVPEAAVQSQPDAQPVPEADVQPQPDPHPVAQAAAPQPAVQPEPAAEPAPAPRPESAPHADHPRPAQGPQSLVPADVPQEADAAHGEPEPVPMAADAAPAEPDHPRPADVPAATEPHPDDSLGQFVPVDGGQVPTTPHLAPTPPEALTLPLEEAAPTPDAATAVPAPREADPELVQNADDLDTHGAGRPDDEEQDEEQADQAPPEARRSTGPAAPAYADAEREAVLKVMRERRDIRNGFRSDPIPHEVLLRVLEAAHTAPSVGHSQPWDFVVIRSADTRRAMHELAMRQRDAYAKSLPKGRAKQFKELKIEAILDTPVNIVVTADPTRGGRHTLGRHTQPQMAPYSSALAVENLWLAARAEGLGVGWVSFFDEREMVRALGLPEHLDVVAYLCVGYVDEFPDEPELMQAGWSKRRPLSWVVHEETYGRRALPGEEPHDLLAETVAQIRPLDAKALGEAWERQKRMTKPAGALGMLEIISAQLSGLSRQCPPPIPEPAAVAVFAGDHGVHAQGVTPWPQEVTAQMVANFLGGGAVCNAFATQVGAEVCVVDVGVATDLPATPGLLPRKVRAGTSDMTTGPAMTREEAKQAIEVGIETARDLVAAGNKALLTGEMGIANTTASAALISVFTGADPAEVTGRGTGINDETLARKTEVVRRALELHQPDPADPIGVLAAIGGFEHAAMVGLLLGGASLRTPVLLDGVSAGAAALVARAIAPEVLAACIAGHRSAEPGHVAALNKLGLRPLVDLDLRLGEGTGALLALPMVQSTARAMHEVATFDSAGVTEK
ncbi:nicotinate-nucleotide--dimethylbenzimidazole phosphoribosyltransferase [Streptomyces sp. NPDC053750]|uniref:nicotinate-nucleotide--dimethylbenzimidazole phosphoribosyltransferase n=1 Tax=Streptomyces sp. NPDC053750 TaxID=3365714 RepID=UPI0037CED48B